MRDTLLNVAILSSLLALVLVNYGIWWHSWEGVASAMVFCILASLSFAIAEGGQ